MASATMSTSREWQSIQVNRDSTEFRKTSDFEWNHPDTSSQKYVQSKGAESDNECLAPAFTQSLEDTYIAYGDNKVLDVVVRGTPLPCVRWFKDGRLIGEKNIERDGNVYRVYIIDAVDSDSGVYSVEAVNDFGETKCYARLFVGQDRLSSQMDATCAPRFLKHFSDTYAAKSENVVFEAIVAGCPKPSVQWLFNNVPIRNSRYHYSNVDDMYTLIVSNCNVQDCGKFTIQAENHMGNTSCSARLFISEDTDRTILGTPYGTTSNTFNQDVGKSTVFEKNASKFFKDDYSQSRFDECRNVTRSNANYRPKIPEGYNSVHHSQDKTRRRARAKRSDNYLGSQKFAHLRISSDDDCIDYSDSEAREIKRIHEFSRNVTERSIREHVPVSDTGHLNNTECSKRYRPVELIVGKPRRQRTHKHHRRSNRNTHSIESGHKHNEILQRKRQIRLGSVPIGEHSRRILGSDENVSYAPIDLILNKPRIKRVATSRQSETDLITKEGMLYEQQKATELRGQRSRHSSTVVKQPTHKQEWSEFRVEGEHEKRILTDAVGIESEVEIKIPKSRHTSQIYRQAKEKKPIVLNITESSVIPGQDSIRIHDKPLQIDEEILVRVKKTGGEHSSTVVRDNTQELRRIDVPFPSKITGLHELRVVDDSVEAESTTEVKIPKPRTVHGDHSSTVMKEQFDKKRQIVNLQVPNVIPGEMSETKYGKIVGAQDIVDVKLPKKECRHSSTVIQKQTKDHSCFDVDMVQSIPGESDYKTMIIQPESTELVLPKSQSKHSSTIVCEKAEKVSLGKTRSLSGEHLYKIVDNSKSDFSSTVMVDKSRLGTRGTYDINLTSEVSEIEEDVDQSMHAKEGHVVSWLSDVSEREKGITKGITEESRHLTTVVKKQDTREEIEMSLPHPMDTSEIVTRVGNYINNEAIFLNGPTELIDEDDEEYERKSTKDEKIYDVRTSQYVMEEHPRTQEASIRIDTGVKRERVIGVQMSKSSSEVVAELKSAFEVKGDQIQPADTQSTIILDFDSRKSYAPVEVNIPTPSMEPSKSVLVADVRAAYQGPQETLVTNEQSSSQIVIQPSQMGTYELNICKPELENSTSTVIADVKAHLSAQSEIGEYVQMESSSSCVNMDVGKRRQLQDIQVNIPDMRVEESRSEVIAQVESKLSTNENFARSTVEPQSSYSLCMSNISGDEAKSVDVRVRNVRMGDSKSEVVVNLPGKAQSQLIGKTTCESSSSITVNDTTPKPMEITMNVSDCQPSSSTLITKTTRRGLATAEIKNFGGVNRAGEFDIVLHQPRQSYLHESLEHKRRWETSKGSSTVIKDIGFDDDSTDRYYLSDGELSSSTMQVDVGKYDTDYTSMAPRFISELKDVNVREGERLVLSCQVIGAQHVEWMKDGKHTASHCQLDFIDNILARLTISEVFEDDSGMYTCIAISSSKQRTQTSSFVSIIVQPTGSTYQQITTGSIRMTRSPPSFSTSRTIYEHTEKIARAKDTSGSQTGGISQSLHQQMQTLEATKQDNEVRTYVDPFAMFGARRKRSLPIDKKEEEEEGKYHVSFEKSLPTRITKTTGSFVRLEVVLSGPAENVQWKLDAQTVDDRSDLRITSSGNTYSLVIPRIARNHAGTYSVTVIGKNGQTINSNCTVEVKETKSRFDEDNTVDTTKSEEINLTNKGGSSSAISRQDLHIRASKSPKPETRITVREASADNSIFTFSETEDGQFVSVNTTDSMDK